MCSLSLGVVDVANMSLLIEAHFTSIDLRLSLIFTVCHGSWRSRNDDSRYCPRARSRGRLSRAARVFLPTPLAGWRPSSPGSDRRMV